MVMSVEEGPWRQRIFLGRQTMMQLARRTPLVVLLLLASAATAYAECAWVL